MPLLPDSEEFLPPIKPNNYKTSPDIITNASTSQPCEKRVLRREEQGRMENNRKSTKG